MPDAQAACPPDRVKRQFKAERRIQLWVVDLTCVSTRQALVAVVFVIDDVALRMAGCRGSRSLPIDFVLDALEQALHAQQARQRECDGYRLHHSDRRSRHGPVRHSKRLAKAGIDPSASSPGDSDDSALAATMNRLFKVEVIHRRGRWKTREAVELVTLEWVSWLNHHRLQEPAGNNPPTAAEAMY